MKNLKNIIKKAIDIHVHIGPEVIPRKYTLPELLKTENGKIGGFVLKNHFSPTSPFIQEAKGRTNLKLFGGIVLNNAIGGLNQEAIFAANAISEKPIVVWFPTINAKNFLDQSEYEIAPEWVNDTKFTARKAKDVKAVLVTKNNALMKAAREVLRTIKNTNAILATGHISWRESEILVSDAKKIGIQNIVITHPIYQRINMPMIVLQALANQGCFIEHSYSMYSIDKIPIQQIAKQIKAIGSRKTILSSDVGQIFSPPPSEALYLFASLLQRQGISEKDLYTMLVLNPKQLLNIT